jgi:hypothetical protein
MPNFTFLSLSHSLSLFALGSSSTKAHKHLITGFNCTTKAVGRKGSLRNEFFTDNDEDEEKKFTHELNHRLKAKSEASSKALD